jgi:hypothetical protein
MNEDKIIQKLGEHDKRFDRLEGKFDDLGQRVLTTQDKILTIVRRLDEERIFTTKWVERIEQEVDKIKTHLKIK